MIKKLIGRFRNSRTRLASPEENVLTEATEPNTPGRDYESIVTHPRKLRVGVGQSVGRQRTSNEDALFMFDSLLSDHENQINYGMFIIADGMGGHQHGEIASRHAIHTASASMIQNHYCKFLEGQNRSDTPSVHEVLEESFAAAHLEVLRSAPGGGTTLTAVLIVGEQFTVAHVGDSRAYVICGGKVELLTQDHTLINKMIEIGQISEDQARRSPHKNVLLRALGQQEPLEIDIFSRCLPERGYLLLCSDGLWGSVNEGDILKILKAEVDPQAACDELVKAANVAGGPDNISVILIQV